MEMPKLEARRAEFERKMAAVFYVYDVKGRQNSLSYQVCQDQ